MNCYLLTSFVGLLAASLTARAHPGHSPGDVPPSHALLSPDHLGALLVAGVLFVCLFQVLRWRKRQRPPVS